MAQATEFPIGATASCPGGVRGKVSRMIVDPAARTVTHLVIEPKRSREPGRLVPSQRVDTTVGDASPGCAWRGCDRRQRSGLGTRQGAGMSTPAGHTADALLTDGATRHSRLQRHGTSPLGSCHAEEFEFPCRGYRDDPGRGWREVSSEIRRSHGPYPCQRQRIRYSPAVDSPVEAYANHVRQHLRPGNQVANPSGARCRQWLRAMDDRAPAPAIRVSNPLVAMQGKSRGALIRRGGLWIPSGHS
jgi:hypothetical protein